MSEQIILYYAHDPMCSFCWAFRPTWSTVKSELLEHYPEIKIQYLLGGLAPDSDQIMPEEVRAKVQSAWRYIEKNIPGTRFNHDFWVSQQPRRSTYPSCRAVVAVKMLAPELEDEIILAIQQAYYLQALNPSDDDTLIGCAEKIGLDAAVFKETYQSDQCNQAFMQESQFCRSIGMNSFPSIVLVRGENRFNVPIEYNHADKLLDSLRQIATLL